MVQLSHPCTTTGKTIAWIKWAFFDKVMSLLFNMLSRLVITFLLRSNLEGLMSSNCIFKYGSRNVSTVPPEMEDLKARCFLAIRFSTNTSNKAISETK